MIKLIVKLAGAFWANVEAEPVAAQGMVQAGVGLVCAFGLRLTPVQIGATMIFSAAVLAFFTRKAVTPIARLPAPPDPLV